MSPSKPNNKITVITSHLNADFDAIASMLAAQKLYPGALVVFPGSKEKTLRNFFIQSMVYLFNIVDINDIDFNKIEKLILVDTCQAGRIGKFADILRQTGIEIHIYDHHPSRSNDIQGIKSVRELTGATVTILTDIIRGQKIGISPDEATLMCLGIYEDTGSFTYPSTTEKDLRAAAFLVSKGADINIISKLIVREISPEQLSVLNSMIQAATHYRINGFDIIITIVTMDNYLPDFAFLVHKMVRMENLNVIFAIALMDNKIYIVGRSGIPEVDTGAILSNFGGGGHTFAASASFKGATLAQTEQKLLSLLRQEIKSPHIATSLMTAPPITISAQASCSKANEKLTRYNVNALLVTKQSMDQENLLGYITRQVIEKAIFHKLDQVPVGEYMTTEISQVEPDADLSEIQAKIIDNKQRLLPVVKQNKIIGVITRTDLLEILIQHIRFPDNNRPNPYQESSNARTRMVQNFMKERINPHIYEILITIGKVATQSGFKVYLIGGFVRDLFLYRSNEDIDIVIEGDGIAFAKKYAELTGAGLHYHKKFGTAIIIADKGLKIDVASARMEYYKYPAALPTVEMSSLKLDLFRRDFTINTLAIQLNPNKFGYLFDFFGAQKDIKDKAIRALHNLSFVEDPTRAYRAIRFEQRFGFFIGKLTAGLIKNAKKMGLFDKLQGRRLFTELRLILKEEDPIPPLLRLDDFHLLEVIHPALKINDQLVFLLNSVKKVLAWHDLLFLNKSFLKWAVYFMILIQKFDRKETENLCNRLQMDEIYKKIFISARFSAERCLFWLQQNQQAKNSRLYNRLNNFKAEQIIYMMAVTKSQQVKKNISFFYTKLSHVTISITGKDIMKTGLKPGPAYRITLQAALEAKLNGLIKTHADELAFMKEYVKGL